LDEKEGKNYIDSTKKEDEKINKKKQILYIS